MFTGIVEEVGLVERVESGTKSIRLAVACKTCGVDTKVGDSIAVNGCCLTVVRTTRSKVARVLEFDLLRETWTRTNLHAAPVGAAVNLERSLRADDRMGGHFVTGHIDGTGEIRRWERSGSDWVLEVKVPTALLRYLVFKGAVALDGISLTVAAMDGAILRIWIIPHTLEVTALRERKVGDLINIEADLLSKYVERLFALQAVPAREAVAKSRLRLKTRA